MSFFDKLKNQAMGAVSQAAGSAASQTAGKVMGQVSGAVGNAMRGGNKSVSVVFGALPATQMEFSALPQAAMQTPHDTAAMFVVALAAYKHNKQESIAMMNFLKGPQPMSGKDISFIADRMSQNDKIGYLAESFFAGATPQNDYTPSQPYTVTVLEDPYTWQEQGYAKVLIPSGGADTPRPVKLRQAKDGRWYLWEQFLMSDIRPPESSNPWA